MSKKKVNILLVDDNPKFLASAAERAKLKGFSVYTAENGGAAMEIAQKTTIHVAVVDQQMPDMEGLVVITKLKAIWPDIRTILLTGHGGEKLKKATEALNSTYFDKEEMGNFWEFLSNLPIGGINILLVDDNEKFVNTLADRIRLKGYDPLIALNGREALEIAASNKIQIAVVDQRMPDMDGLVVITKLKEIDPDIDALLLTGHGDEKLREATQALDAQYFEKAEMSKFWSFIRRNLQRLERHLAAAGMAEGGDIEDAVGIETKHKKKS
ncbi:MAG: response regulator [Deltaproteobacteria bacterium]|jgi:DNA-binding NtrC family response regulator|nr:response regulator [Deltaproteobacteria bacterium]